MKAEKNRNALKKQIEGLKQMKSPNIWESISSKLDSQAEENRDALNASIDSMPKLEAPNVWVEVSSNLDIHKESKWKYLAIAASISFIAAMSYSLLPNRSSEKLSYTTEQMDFFETSYFITDIHTNSDDLLLTYIKENCSRLATTCQNPEFKELLAIYMELDQTKRELNQTMEKSNDPARVMKYLIKVEKNQTEIGKDMLKKLKSI